MKKFTLIITVNFILNFIYSQNPTIIGNSMLCPQSTTELSTQSYDTYQWKKRVTGSNTPENIVGAINQTLTIDDYNYVVTYVSVEVTLNGESFISEEIFIDGWAFLPIYVIIDGDFTISPTDGSLHLNQGGTIELTSSYTDNVKWYKDDQLISGQTSPILQVNEPGIYQVHAFADAALCPNYSSFSLPISVQGPLLDLDDNFLTKPSVFPNPTQNILNIQTQEAIIETSVFDMLGKKVTVNQLSANSIDVLGLAKGIYLVKVVLENGQLFSSKFIKE